MSDSTIEVPLIEALKNSPTEFAALNAPDPSGLIWAFTPHYPKKLDIPDGRAASAYPGGLNRSTQHEGPDGNKKDERLPNARPNSFSETLRNQLSHNVICSAALVPPRNP